MAKTGTASASGVLGRLFGGYAQLLAIPHSARFSIGSVIACMPLPMVGMTITVSVQQHYGNYTIAGILAAIEAISYAVLGPLLGRLADRFGQRVVAIPSIIVWIVASQAFIFAVTSHAPEWVLVCLAPLLAFIPPWGAMSRTRWRHLLRGDEKRISTSLSLCSVFDECMWLVGNPLSSILAVMSGFISFSFAGVCVVIGSIMVLTEATTQPPSQTDLAREAGLTRKEYRARVAAEALEPAAEALSAGEGRTESSVPAAGSRSAARRTSIWGPGMVALCAVYFGLGAFQNATGVSIIAFSRELGVPELAGVVIACFSISSLTGALFFGAIPWKTPLWKRFYFCLVVLALGLSLFVLAPTLWVIGLIYLVVGLCQAPIFINGNEIVVHLVSPMLFTEAVAWTAAMYSIGSSAGSAIAGPFIDAFGHTGGFAVVGALAALTLAISLVGVRQIRRATEQPMPVA